MVKTHYENTKSELKKKFSDNVSFAETETMKSVIIEKDITKDVIKFLMEKLEYQQLVDIFAVDYPEHEKRFEINYNLLSISHNIGINLKTHVAEDEQISSVVDIFKSAGWLEREAWDMYGVKFEGNPDLRRILTDYEFEGHPMRKDFPLTGYKEIKYDAEKREVVYQPVDLSQEFRRFDFESPWEGPNYSDSKRERK